jgi:hypothetical protein
MPRSRTTWIAALFCAHGVETVHEAPLFFKNIEEVQAWVHSGSEADPRGYVDGLAIVQKPDLVLEHFAGCPIVIIDRPYADVRASWTKWHSPISDEHFKDATDKVDAFKLKVADWPNVLTIPYAVLDDYHAVNAVFVHCTGRDLKPITWRLFNHIKIELHAAKALADLEKDYR